MPVPTSFRVGDEVVVSYKDVTTASGFSEDITRYLRQLPTLTVSRSSADPRTKSISFASGQVGVQPAGTVQCVNFISPVAAILQSATMTKGANYYFFQTGGIGSTTLTLDNGGTVGGVSAYNLSGSIQFVYDGTNLQS